jgi:hypothetical protein
MESLSIRPLQTDEWALWKEAWVGSDGYQQPDGILGEYFLDHPQCPSAY